MERRRRRSAVLVLLLAAGAAVGFDLAHAPVAAPDPGPTVNPAARDLAGSYLAAAEPVAAAARRGSAAAARVRPVPAFVARPTPDETTAASAPAASAPAETGTEAVAPGYPRAGIGAFGYANGTGAVLGSAGSVRRYRVAVEQGTGQSAAGFAAEVDAILGDPRGWTQDGLRFQRVPRAAAAAFTIYLASPTTSEALCAAGGLHTEGFTSCRLPGQVIINLARWLGAVPGYGAPLEVYRAYALNHETGHELGYGHEACPAPGRPAPVMQQQTYGLQGCVANGWPYLNGRRYTGPPVP